MEAGEVLILQPKARDIVLEQVAHSWEKPVSSVRALNWLDETHLYYRGRSALLEVYWFKC